MPDDVSKPEIIRFVTWFVATFATSLTATIIIERRAVAVPESGQLSTHFLAIWGATWGGSLFLLSIFAGALVFRRSTPWGVVLTWPWLVGPIVGLASFLGFTPQMDAGSKLCDAPANGSCDTAWGMGAALLSIAAAIALGGTFVAVASFKRLILRSHHAG